MTESGGGMDVGGWIGGMSRIDGWFGGMSGGDLIIIIATFLDIGVELEYVEYRLRVLGIILLGDGTTGE